MPAVNQNYLAKHLRLSRTTVSRSLSNHPAISTDTRSRVQSLAAKLGYRVAPTKAVRRPRDAKPITIGVLIGAPLVPADRATLPTILQGIRHRASIEHAAIDVAQIDPDPLAFGAIQRKIFRNIRSAHWRGALLIYPFPSELVQALRKKISVVSVLAEYDDSGIDVVDTDHHGIALLVNHLFALGHRKIGFISWRYVAGGLWASRRFAAFAEALFGNNLTVNRDLVFNLGWQARGMSPGQLADAVSTAVRGKRVTAWVCAADHQAYQLISDLRERGIRVPEDCSVTGFDGNPTPRGLPPLTTVHVSNEEVGEAAVAQLISRLLYPRSGRRKIFVETEYRPGRTTARITV